MGWDTSSIGSTTFATGKGERWVGSGNLASCSRAEAPTSEAFFNVRGTWHFSPHGAPLWFAVRFSVLWPDDPSMQDARGTPFNHMGHTAQLLCGQSTLTNGQGSEHFLVAFYDKFSAAAGLFFSLIPETRTRLMTTEGPPVLCLLQTGLIIYYIVPLPLMKMEKKVFSAS